MKILFLIPFFIFTKISAHPPIAIVCDNKGNIYYSDLRSVWKVDQSGKRVAIVKDVHTHELYMDRHDNLYGQGSIYSGEKTNRYYYYVWRFSNEKKLDTVIPLKEGFYIENFSFARDINDNMYWIKHVDRKTFFMKTSSQGFTSKIADGDFSNVQWIRILNGTVYYVQYDNIYKMDNKGRTTIIVSKINGTGSNHNSIFGIWGNRAGELYFANTAAHQVEKISKMVR
jgi:hypothetical protein